MSYCVGIDLGTSTTCVSVVENGKARVVPMSGDRKIIPSYIHVRDDGRVLVGDAAKSESIADPYNTIWASKRLIGREYEDEGVRECMKRLPYNISCAPNGDCLIHGREKSFPPEWVASLIIKFVTLEASKAMAKPVKKAVITVPGSFNQRQRDYTTKAAQKVGIEVLRLINEPTAAAIAWGFHNKAEQTIAVFDLGGGTFDVSVIEIGKGAYKLLSSKGDAWLGGEDFDYALVDYIAKDFKKSYKINIFNDKVAHLRLKFAAELAKITLTDNESARIYIPTICPDVSKVADVDYMLDRVHYERMIDRLANRTMDIFSQALEEAGIKPEDLDNIIMVGGMTRTPLIRKKLEALIGRPADTSINPDEVVAKGAAICAASMSGEKVSLKAPASTKPVEEYLSGDMDMEGMYNQALVEKEQEQDQEPAQPMQAQAPNVKTQMLMEVYSEQVSGVDVAGVFPAAFDQMGQPVSVQGGITMSSGQREGLRLKIFQGGNGSGSQTLLGEFIIQGVEGTNGTPHIKILYNVDRNAPFSITDPHGKRG